MRKYLDMSDDPDGDFAELDWIETMTQRRDKLTMAANSVNSTKVMAGETIQRKHRATYAANNREGGFNVRVVGPYPNRFAGREIPVTTKSGDEHMEKMTKLLWTGEDKDPQTGELTGKKAALYQFEARPREIEEPEF